MCTEGKRLRDALYRIAPKIDGPTFLKMSAREKQKALTDARQDSGFIEARAVYIKHIQNCQTCQEWVKSAETNNG